MKYKILYVEDDVNLAFVVKDTLAGKDYDVVHVTDGNRVMQALKNGPYDLILLDVMLPGMDGFSISKRLREEDYHTPVLFLTARGLADDRIKGFESGADDYLAKPFNIVELDLRMKAILRRSAGKKEQPVAFGIGNYFFDYNTFLLTHAKQQVTVTKKEADLLVYLFQNRNKTVTRSDILVQLWGENDYFKGRSMDVFIARLRRYFSLDASVNIVNIHSVGFRLETAEQ